MLFMGLIRWWYGEGWRLRAKLISLRLDSVMDYFSIDLLLKTLFSPFRQISAGKVDGPLGEQLRAFADRIISRLIGALIRTILLVVGLIAIAVQALVGLVVLAGWAIVPALPVLGIVAMLAGWLV